MCHVCHQPSSTASNLLNLCPALLLSGPRLPPPYLSDPMYTINKPLPVDSAPQSNESHNKHRVIVGERTQS